jgi:hypothetical protein
MESEVPEADAVEQHTEVVEEVDEEEPPPRVSHDLEVPEADAYEQSIEVPLDADEEWA